MCNPLPNNVSGKRRIRKEKHKHIKGTKRDQEGSKKTTICKCGPMGCGCAPVPEKPDVTAFRKEDVPTSPHPVDLAIGWPFGYGPSFGWGPGLR